VVIPSVVVVKPEVKEPKEEVTPKVTKEEEKEKSVDPTPTDKKEE